MVEDDPDVRELLSSLLADAGYEVALAADGDEAIGHVAERAPDAVVLDLLLPGETGWEIAPRLHVLAGRRVPIIVATAASPSLFRLPTEVTCVIPKPFDPDTVLLAVGSAVRTGRDVGTARAA